MNNDAMITTFKSLKLFGMADTVANLATQGSPAYQQALNLAWYRAGMLPKILSGR